MGGPELQEKDGADKEFVAPVVTTEGGAAEQAEAESKRELTMKLSGDDARSLEFMVSMAEASIRAERKAAEGRPDNERQLISAMADAEEEVLGRFKKQLAAAAESGEFRMDVSGRGGDDVRVLEFMAGVAGHTITLERAEAMAMPDTEPSRPFILRGTDTMQATLGKLEEQLGATGISKYSA